VTLEALLRDALVHLYRVNTLLARACEISDTRANREAYYAADELRGRVGRAFIAVAGVEAFQSILADMAREDAP
jgi:hypothetical protein